MFENKYRVVTDNLCGYKSEVKFWWFPLIWFSIDHAGESLGFNTWSTKIVR